MDDQDIDNLLDDDTDITPLDFEIEQVENAGTGEMGEVLPPPLIFDELPQLLGEGYTDGFLRMVEKVHAMYRILPTIDHVACYNELIELTVKTVPMPSPSDIDCQLGKIQAVKERLSEILTPISRVQSFKKRQVEILKESWIGFSQEKSADKRKADAVYRISEFESDYLGIYSLWVTANSVLSNLTAVQDIVSRRITIVGHEIKLFEMGRTTTTPDYDFQGASLSDGIGTPVDELVDGNLGESGTPLGAEECEF
jgi:hypothetical protein